LLGQPFVHSGDPLGGDQSQVQVVDVQRLGQIIVGAGLHALERMGAVAESGQQDEVRIGPGVCPHHAAQLGALDTWHQPVADDHVGALGAEQIPCLSTVGGRQAFVPEALNRRLQHLPRGSAVLDDEYFHIPSGSSAKSPIPVRHSAAFSRWKVDVMAMLRALPAFPPAQEEDAERGSLPSPAMFKAEKLLRETWLAAKGMQRLPVSVCTSLKDLCEM
jgi:hypothetical protein